MTALNDTLTVEGGYLTKTHLYVHWPAEHTKPSRLDKGGKEIVPALTLKIPVEYLYQSTISSDGAANILLHNAGWKEGEKPSSIDYRTRITESLSIHDRQITMVSLALLPGAKPYVRELPFKDDPPDLAHKKLENFLGSYAVHIEKDVFYA